MRRLGIAVTLLLSTAAFARGISFQTDGDHCNGRNIRFDDEPAAVEEQVIEAGSLRSLKASVTHAPIAVRGGSGSGYTITVCKAAELASDLAAIRVSVDGGVLKSTGPDNGRWAVHYKITVPRGANLDLETQNGPISFTDVDGTVVAHASNGPLSLSGVSGDFDVTTKNGPVSVRGGSGNVKVRASNGPLSINLDGTSWRGGSLDASTNNGPLSVKLPRDYASGVTVESQGRGPISCRAAGCARYRAMREADDDRWNDNDEPRTIELGSGSPAVRVSTVNGPVTIKDE